MYTCKGLDGGLGVWGLVFEGGKWKIGGKNVTQSGFLPFARSRKGSEFLRLRPPKWFKAINRSSMSTLTQMCTNHAPTGEYFK